MNGIILAFRSILSIYEYAILLYIIMSWVPEMRETQFGQILERLVEPYLSIFRNIIPPIGMIDFSPIVAFLVLSLASEGLLNILVF